jgi:hypothetical protein
MVATEWSADEIKRRREAKQLEARQRVRERYRSGLVADEYAQLFPAKPKALRKIARAFRKLSGSEGKGKNRPFTVDEWSLPSSRVCPDGRYSGTCPCSRATAWLKCIAGGTAVLALCPTRTACFSAL